MMSRLRALRPIIYNSWLALSTLVAWVATETLFGKLHGMAIMLSYTAPLVLVALAHFTRRLLGNRIDFKIRPPRLGKPGAPNLTHLLAAMHGKLGLQETDQLRLTLFVPDTQNMRLVQIARYRWDCNSAVSKTTIRMGTCAVGHAYVSGSLWYVADVDREGGFDRALLTCGLTKEEVREQQLQRRSFAAIPLFTTNHAGEQIVFAVLALDTATPSALPPEWQRIVLTEEPRLRQLVLGDAHALSGGGRLPPAENNGGSSPKALGAGGTS